jgi:HlyD family secretion protein
VKFSVQALPKQTFEGTVRQVRLQSATNENVVNYTVVVAVSNPEKKLLPGMTARLDFLTKSADDVLKVANAALRFKPAETEVATPATTATSTAARASGANTPRRARTGQGASTGRGTLYVVAADGKLQPLRVRTGITDGTTTEILGNEIKEGMKVVAGTQQPQSAETTSSANPFQQNNQQQQRGPRPGGF